MSARQVRATIRPQEGALRADLLQLDTCRVDLGRMLVLRAKETEPLSTKEAQLLAYLSARAGQTITYEELLREVWGYRNQLPSTRPYASVMCRLRQKIEVNPVAPVQLITVLGEGYRFEATHSPQAPPKLPRPGCVRVAAEGEDGEALAAELTALLIEQGLNAHQETHWEETLDAVDRLVLVLSAQEGPSELVVEMLRQAEERGPRLILVRPAGRPATAGWPGVVWHGVADLPQLLRDIREPLSLQALALDASTSAPLQPPGGAYCGGDYLRRPELESAAATLLTHPGTPVVLVGPRRIGKSWLLQHIAHAACRPDDLIVSVDLRSLGRRGRDPEALCAQLAWELAEATEPDLLDAVEDALRRPGGPRRRLDRFVRHALLSRITGRLLLCLDHVDIIGTGDEASDFFGMLRGWASRQRAPWDRLRILMAVSTEPALLVGNPSLSPFNLSPPVIVDDLERHQVAALAAAHGVSMTTRDLDALIAHVGGHPYLCRVALYAAARQQRPLWALCQDEAIFEDHLRSRLLALQSDPVLRDAVRRVLVSPEAELDYLVSHRLRSGGLLTLEGRTHRLRYPLYANFLRDRL